MKKIVLSCLSLLLLASSTASAQNAQLFEYGKITTVPMSEASKQFRQTLKEQNTSVLMEEDYYKTLMEHLNSRKLKGIPDVKTNNPSEKKEYKNGTVLNMAMNNEKAIIYYLHGGAYAYEMDPDHVTFCDELADRLNAKVVMPDYPLLPKYTYKECYALLDEVYEDLLSYNLPIYVMGDSAGGGLALAFTEHVASMNKVMPKKLVLFSPWVDINTSNYKIPMYDILDVDLAQYAPQQFGKIWSGDIDTSNPLVSPLFGKLSDLPDTLLFTGTNEIMWPDNEQLFNDMIKAGSKVAMIKGEGFWHVYPISPIPEKALFIDMIVKHINE